MSVKSPKFSFEPVKDDLFPDFPNSNGNNVKSKTAMFETNRVSSQEPHVFSHKQHGHNRGDSKDSFEGGENNDHDVSRLVDVSFFQPPVDRSASHSSAGGTGNFLDGEMTMLDTTCMVPNSSMPNEDTFQDSVYDQSTMGKDTMENITMAVDAAQEEKNEVARKLSSIKAYLVDWRELVVVMADILACKKAWYPVASIGVLTLLCAFAWMLPSCFLVLALVCAGSFCLPYVTLLVEKISADSGMEDEIEKRFDEVCSSLLDVEVSAMWWWDHLLAFRRSMPRAFSMIMAFVFLVAFFVFHKLNNLFVLYCCAVVLILAPGIRRAGFLDQITGCWKKSE